MKQKKNNSKNTKEEITMDNSKQDAAVVVIDQQEIDRVVMNDFRNALLLVSLFINVVILIVWLILQATTQHDYEIATMLFVR